MGRGALTRLSYACRVNYKTLWRARNGLPVTGKTAEKISAATGGQVSIESLVIGAPPAKRSA